MEDTAPAGTALVVGESLVDVVVHPDGRVVEHAGGSSANVAVALARLGRPVHFATALAPDDHGRLLRAHLADAGVGLVGEPDVLDRTATAQATLAPDGSARYDFDIAWRLAEVEALAGVERAPTVVVSGSIGAALEPGAHDVARLLDALAGHTALVHDVNARPALTGAGADVRRTAEEFVARADLVKASDEDLEALWPGEPLAEVVAHLLGLGPAAVVVTRGGDGAIWTTRSGTGEVPGQRVDVVDTIGAGDTFGAALVDALWSLDLLGAGARERLAALDGDTWADVVSWATRAAAVTVGRAGADPPYRRDLA